MKGIIFTEFFDLVAERFSEDVLDEIIDRSELPHDGAYTAVGNYPFEELASLLGSLAGVSGLDAEELVSAFAGHLAKTFATKFPQFFENKSFIEFLESVDSHVHVEVRKLYSDANPPEFRTRRLNDSSIEMEYRSHRPLAGLAEGLIRAVAGAFNQPIELTRDDRKKDAGEYVSVFGINLVTVAKDGPVDCPKPAIVL